MTLPSMSALTGKDYFFEKTQTARLLSCAVGCNWQLGPDRGD